MEIEVRASSAVRCDAGQGTRRRERAVEGVARRNDAQQWGPAAAPKGVRWARLTAKVARQDSRAGLTRERSRRRLTWHRPCGTEIWGDSAASASRERGVATAV